MILFLIIVVIILILFVLFYLFNAVEKFENNKNTPIFVISLKRAKDRRQKLKKTLQDEKNVIIINAVDGKNMSPEDIILKEKYIKNNELNPGQIGCFLSHVKIWKYIVDNNIPDAVILEDDIVKLFNLNKLIDIIHSSTNILDFDIIYIGHVFEKQETNRPIIDTYSVSELNNSYEYYFETGSKTQIYPNKQIKFYKSTKPYGTHAYIISNSGAKNLLKIFYDKFQTQAIDIELVNAITETKINSYSMYPTLVNQDGSTSYIENS